MVEYIFSIKKRLFANENNKIIFFSMLGSFFIKGGSLVVSLFTLPAYLNYFNNQPILGLWFTVLSVLSWILTFDLGIGNGLRNHLVTTLVNNDLIKTRKYISSAYIIISIIVIIVSTISIVLFRFINWNLIYNIPPSVVSNETLNMTISIIFIGIMFQFLFTLITSILYAMQKSALTNFLGCQGCYKIRRFILLGSNYVYDYNNYK